MNRNIYKYLYAGLMLASALMLFSACVYEGEGPCPEPDDGTTSYVTFRVVTHKAMAAGTATRAVPDVDDADRWDGYFPEKGMGFDSALIGNQVNVFITDKDITPITRLQNLLYIESTDSDNNVVYSFSGEIPKDDVEILKTKKNAKIHIVANCGSGAALDNGQTFSHAGQPSGTFTAIPMWGVKEFDFTTLKPGQNDLGDIWLLRAMAKVEILIRADEGNIIERLNSASVSDINNKGYVLPAEWNQVTETKKLSFEKTLRTLSSAGGISGMTPADDKTTDKIVFYLPETANTDGNAEITLNYNTADGKERSNTIKFAEYVNGSLSSNMNYDIVRNHLYRFEVYTSQKTALKIEYTVCPWVEYPTIEPPVFE